MSPLAHRDESGSRLTCLKSGDKRTLVRSAIDANDPNPTSGEWQCRSAAVFCRAMRCYRCSKRGVALASLHPVRRQEAREFTLFVWRALYAIDTESTPL